MVASRWGGGLVGIVFATGLAGCGTTGEATGSDMSSRESVRPAAVAGTDDASAATIEIDASPGSLAYDRTVFQTLLRHHASIVRRVEMRPDGVATSTESEDPRIAALIRDHVAAMKTRVHEKRPVRRWDPMFRAIFENADAIEIEYQATPNGIRVVETSDDPKVVKLIQAHAKVVSGFVERGFEEARLRHEWPRE